MFENETFKIKKLFFSLNSRQVKMHFDLTEKCEIF